MTIRFAAALAGLILVAASTGAGELELALAAAPELFQRGDCGRINLLLERWISGPDRDGRALYWIGRCDLDRRQPSKAKRSLELAVELAPSVSDYHLWLARALSDEAQGGNPVLWLVSLPKIRSGIERAIELDPNNVEARMDRVRFKVLVPSLLGGDHNEALREAEAIARIDPVRGSFARGYVHYRAKRYRLAETQFHAAARDAATWSEPLLWLGYLYQETRQYEKAFATLETLRKQDPRSTASYEIARTAVFSGERLERGQECAREALERHPRRGEPSLASAHYVLGRLHEARGSRAEARKQFEAALRLDPGLREARTALRRLR